jgi:serine/threonine protein kinase/Tol biopolymer transport system component
MSNPSFIGVRLGPYEILAALGAGGMGEVYRARDERLHRVVAVKVLSREFAADPERLRRFEQEARNLAALNHPNILAIYDTGLHEGTPYLVSELLEGRTLREELAGGALPVRKVIDYGRQISRGLAAAHGVGIVHRDLKPENIFVCKDGLVKVLDFGLAKAQSASKAAEAQNSTSTTTGSALDDSPTEVQTQPGLVMGTPGYMSPEQVRGANADARSDLFALGSTLYEMLAGQRAFRRETSVQTMSAILTEDPPDLAERLPNLPPPLERAVRRCLEKDPSQRFQSASDLAFALDNISPSGVTMAVAPPKESSHRFPWWQVVPWTVAAAAVIWAALLAGSRPRPVVPQAESVRQSEPLRKFELHVPRPARTGQGPLLTDLALSPDGKKLAYLNADGLWVRRLDQLTPAVLLSNSDKVRAPFWSPRGDEVGYFEGNQLYRVGSGGGKPKLICRAGKELGSAAWTGDDRIFFSAPGDERFTNSLYSVSSNGGDPHPVALGSEPESMVYYLASLRGKGGVLAVIGRGRTGDGLAMTDGSQPLKMVLQLPGSHISRANYSPSGHILYERRGENRGLWAVAFSLQKLETTGEPFRVAEDAALASVAEDGTLAYRPSVGVPLVKRQLVWVDRSGNITGAIGAPQSGLRSPRLAPDDRRIAAVGIESVGSSRIWIFDAAGAAMPMTGTDNFDTAPYWLKDGQRVLFTRSGSGSIHTLVKRFDGTGTEDELFKGAVLDLARKSETVLLGIQGSAVPPRIAGLPGSRRRPLTLPVEFTKASGLKLSPDGTLLAYGAEQSDRPEVYLIAVPALTNKILASRGGGRQPEWSPTGSELFYLSQDGRSLMSVRVQHTDGLEVSEPVKLFDLPETVRNGDFVRNAFDVSSDGQRFVMVRSVRDENGPPPAAPASAIIVLHWFEEFRPTGTQLALPPSKSG